jgi:hypothetical protein
MNRLIVLMAAAALIVGCAAEAPTSVERVDAQFAVTGSSEDPGSGAVTVPFRARFYTDQVGDLVFGVCGNGIAVNTQKGEGQGTHLGRLTTHMVFCFDLNDPPALGDYWFLDGPPGENGRFVAADGDELWITVTDGHVDFFDPDLPPGYQASFRDPFFITGGTGRFEGASGGGDINSLVGIDGRTDHVWTGELTVMRGR